MQTSKKATALTLYILLCLIWGSSFILMKFGLFNNQAETILSPYQLAALRMTAAGIAALPFLKKAIPIIVSTHRLLYVVLCALLGSFIPAFLFCIAETQVDSSVAGMLNAGTPIFATLIGLFLFNQKVTANQLAGVAVGLLGCIMLAMGKFQRNLNLNSYGLLIVAATICYGISVNLVKNKLGDLNPLHLTAAIFIILLPISIAALIGFGFFKHALGTAYYHKALLAGITLGVVGTALATVIFYRLVAIAGVIFSSMVTYGIPIVAIGWGIIYGEKLTVIQVACLITILTGVFLSSWQTFRKQMAKNKNRDSNLDTI